MSLRIPLALAELQFNQDGMAFLDGKQIGYITSWSAKPIGGEYAYNNGYCIQRIGENELKVSVEMVLRVPVKNTYDSPLPTDNHRVLDYPQFSIPNETASVDPDVLNINV